MEDRTATIVRLSKLQYEPLHLNLYENHFSYIKHFKTYAKRYKCNACSRVFNRANNLKRHAKECLLETEEIYIGGKYRNKKNLFELLDNEAIHVPEELRYYPYFSVFDLQNHDS